MNTRSYRFYQLGLAAIGVFTVVLAAMLAMQASSAKQDNTTSQKAQQVADKLNSYTTSHNSVPASLDTLKVSDVPSTVSYTKLSSTSYKFCTTYKSASQNFGADGISALAGTALGGLSQGSSTGGSSFDYGGNGYLYLPSSHKKGQTCQTVNLYSYTGGLDNYTYPVGSGSTGANDSVRQVDMQSLQTQLEAYFAQKGSYPSLADINSSSWRKTNMPGFDDQSLKDPAGTDYQLVAKPEKNRYSYEVTDLDGKSCESNDTTCAQYTLTATLDDGTAYTKSNLD